MKKIAFINAHMNSGGEYLYESLNQDSCIKGFRTKKQKVYLNNYDLIHLMRQKHKASGKYLIYLDEIYYNYALSTKLDLSQCYFIHIIRSPDCLNLIQFNEKNKPVFVIRKYLFRLRRICEIAKRTPNAVFLTFEDLQKERAMEILKEFMFLSDTPKINIKKEIDFKKDLISYDLMKEAEEGYENYLAFLRQQKNLIQLKS